MKLYEISDKIEQVLIAGTDRETGEISDEALAALDELEGAFEAKALNVAAYIKGEEAEAEAVLTESQRLAQRAKLHQRRADRLRSYLAGHLSARTHPSEQPKLADARCAIRWRRSERVEVPDASLIPAEYIREKVVREPDKVALKKALSTGLEIPGASLAERWTMEIK